MSKRIEENELEECDAPFGEKKEPQNIKSASAPFNEKPKNIKTETPANIITTDRISPEVNFAETGFKTYCLNKLYKRSNSINNVDNKTIKKQSISTSRSVITLPNDLLNGISSNFVRIPHLEASPSRGIAKLAK